MLSKHHPPSSNVIQFNYYIEDPWSKLKEGDFMKLAANVKPVGYLKENADEIVRTLSERGGPLIITRDGEAKAVVQDIEEFERTQETLALLKILSLGRKQIEEGRVRPSAEVTSALRENLILM